MSPRIPPIDFRIAYDSFDLPVVPFDCGERCAPHNPGGKPFCCDICQAVPSAYHQEWRFLKANTDLWHIWRGDECLENPEDPQTLAAETPDTMRLLACLGPAHCQRGYRSLSCRQFPFFPYITPDYAFLGLAYNWEFEETCWVISNLGAVSPEYWASFVRFYDDFFSTWPHEMDHYANHSEEMREVFIAQNRSIPILHREGGYYLLRPINGRLRAIDPARLPRYGVYQELE